jgi:hypothetical protein
MEILIGLFVVPGRSALPFFLSPAPRQICFAYMPGSQA